MTSEVKRILDAWNSQHASDAPAKPDEAKAEVPAQERGPYTIDVEQMDAQAHNASARETRILEQLQALYGNTDLQMPSAEELTRTLRDVTMRTWGGGFDYARHDRERRQTATERNVQQESERRLEAEMHQKAKALGWSESLRRTDIYREFIRTMMDIRKCMEQHDDRALARYKERGQQLYNRLQAMHAGETESRTDWYMAEPDMPVGAPQRSIDHFRDREARNKRKAKRR